MKFFIKIFSSVKLAVFLLVIIILVITLGTFIPQGGNPEAYTDRYGSWGEVLIHLGMTRLYQSPWFLTLLVLFALNTIICSMTRINKKFKKTFHPKVFTREKNLSTLQMKKEIRSPQSTQQAAKNLQTILRSRGYKIRTSSNQGQIYVLARKKILGLFGSDLVHLGVLFVIAAGFISSLSAFRTNLALLEKETKTVPKSGFSITLDQFKILYYPDKSIKDWKSTLSVIKQEKTILTKTIEVNHPLSYEGYLFYQSGYGWDWKNPMIKLLIETKIGDVSTDRIRLRVGDKNPYIYQNLHINALYFVPDFVINENNKVSTRSLEPNNPAVYVKVSKQQDVVFSGWLFLKFPEFISSELQKKTGLYLKLTGFDAEPYSVIQVSKDPGASFIWMGCFFVMIGLFLAFYF
ncbi:MAG: hypothetical protein GF421_06080, partial [Candidatus Aminicenantes bacterium]|nr:hypothetical protein [Candidatus Aminicenantes bacterium]